MGDRARFRKGRGILYNPTTAEAAARGVGPWMGVIVDVNANGTVDLRVFAPDEATLGAVLTDPLVTSANAAAQTGAYVQADVQSIATLANELKTDLNAVVTRLNEVVNRVGDSRKAGVTYGPLPGQFEFAPIED